MIPFITHSLSVSADEILLGIHPFKSAKTIQKTFTPLAEYISDILNQPVRIEISRDYQHHIQLISENKLDIAYMGPVSFVQLINRHGDKPILARLEVQGTPTFQGFIISRDDSSIRTISDIVGKRFAFGSPSSTMSHLVPRHMMWKAGISVNKLEAFDFLGNHHNVAMAVLAGKYDVGAVKEAVFYEYQARGLRSVAATPKLSEHVFVASSRLSEIKIQRIREGMLRLHKTSNGIDVLHAIKGNATGLVPAQTSDYDNLRKILTDLAAIGVE